MYNTDMEYIIIFLIAFIIGFLIAWLVKPNKSNTEILRILDDRMLAGFKVMSVDILKQQTAQSKDLVVTPALAEIKTITDNLGKTINDMNTESAVSRGSLKRHMEEFSNYNRELGKFFNAFHGQKKLQGNWGEAVLERTLELFGFRKGREYDREFVVTNDNGETLRLDCVLHLPDNKKVIIDSKMSFNSFMNYINAEEESEKQMHLSEMVNATKQHIDSLAAKEYQKQLKEYCLDYIFMIIPREEMYFAILEKMPSLHEYAYKNNIAIITPSLLFPMMRTINNLISLDAQNKDIGEVVYMVHQLYEKYVGFTANFVKIKSKLDDATDAYNNAHGQLINGSGNMGGWIEKIKKKSRITTTKAPAIAAEVDDE